MTNHLTSPIGYQMDQPVFSWQVEKAEGKKQTAARIVVAKDMALLEVVADTGWSELDSLAAPVDLSPAPRTRYYWTVAVRSDAGEEAVSEIQFFETGMMGEPWQAKWITCDKKERLPVFHKQISVNKPLERARLYICGLGLYEASINGGRIGEEYFTPYCNNYSAWLQVQTYDVTDELRCGGELSVLLGDGWYAGCFGYASKPGDPGNYGQERKMIAQLYLTFSDGSVEIIGSDETWYVTRSHITFSGIYDGEYRDDTLSESEPEEVIVTSENAPLTDRYSLPVIIHERMMPISLIHTPAGETVLDLGQNLVGIFSFHVHEKTGTKISLQFGEVLQNGCFYRENYRTALSEYSYVCKEEDVWVRPHFTFFGYRYVKIEGIKNLQKEDFTALVLYSDLPETGTLMTGNEKVNRLVENVKWGQRGNSLDVPTDCPQRDERLGWTGDAQVFSATSCYLRDSYAFYRKYLHDMYTEQLQQDGMVPDIVPSISPVYQTTAAVWGDAACIIPWNLYLFYGDLSILSETYPSMKAWVDYVRRQDGEDHAWREQFQYGDWLALDHPSGRPDQCLGGTDEGYISTVYYMNSADILSRTADLLGKKADAKEYGAIAAKLKDFLQAEYFAPNGRCVCDTQTGLILALQYDLSPNPDACRARLLQKLKQTGGKLQTGFVGTPFLCRQLTEAGKEREAYDLLLKESYPGWLYEVNLGATTIWERWNSLNPDGSISSTGMNSFNHYAYGAIAEWMFRSIGGLQADESAPGFRKARICPVPDMRIGSAHLSYYSAAGLYKIDWEILEERKLHLRVVIPFGCEADVYLPHSKEEPVTLPTGCYEWTYETDQPMRRLYHIELRLRDILDNPGVRKVLDEVVPGMSALPDSMQGWTVRELLSDPRIMQKNDETIKMLEKRLSHIW